MKKIDQDTVELLQLLAPGKSRMDAKTSCGLVLGGHAFGEFNDEERQSIWACMKDFDGLIPSLYTFFEDFKYLESCAQCVKRLFGPSISIWQTMSSIFVPGSNSNRSSEAGQGLIQTSESNFRRQQATDMARLETGYVQVWLYAMRHYPLMPPDPKNEDDLLARPTRAKPDQRAIFEMAELAHRLGFKSAEIDELVSGSPDHQIARSALLQARKPDRYRYDHEKFDILVGQIVSCFGHAVPDKPDRAQHLLADSNVKPRRRSGMPQTRTQNQDKTMLFLDCLYADVEVADTITSFFVRRCVYFAFFGKLTLHGLISDGDQPMGDVPQSPLFVEEEEPTDSQEQNMHAAPPSVPILDRPDELERDRARPREARQSMDHQQKPRSENARDHGRRRRRKVQVHGLTSRRVTEREPEPMEWDLLDTETSDHDVLSESSPRNENISPLESNIEPAPTDSATAHACDSHGPTELGGADAISDCTRISFEVNETEQDPEEGGLTVAPGRQDSLGDRTKVNNAPPLASAEPEADHLSHISDPPRQHGLDAFLDHLQKAQEEQERLEEEMGRERLNEELGLSNQARLPPGDSPGFEDRQNSLVTGNEPVLSGHTEIKHSASALNFTGQDLSRVSLREGQPEFTVENPDQRGAAVSPQPQQGPVEIQFWAFEREQWRQSDRLLVDPSNTSPVEQRARKYLWKGYSLYDLHLQSLSPAHCFRAATADGRNAIFMISEHEERKLAAAGRPTKEKQLLAMASRVGDRADDEDRFLNRGQRGPHFDDWELRRRTDREYDDRFDANINNDQPQVDGYSYSERGHGGDRRRRGTKELLPEDERLSGRHRNRSASPHREPLDGADHVNTLRKFRGRPPQAP
jgi:hypothetical protein